MIEEHSDALSFCGQGGVCIDTADFDKAHQRYDAAGYYLNGVLDAGIALHAALKQILLEGMCRFLFNEGLIKILTYFEEAEETVDYSVSTDEIKLRSRKTSNLPTSSIKNDIKIFFDKDYFTNVYDGEASATNDESVVKFYNKEYRRELDLIDSPSVAQAHADRLLAILGVPNSIFSFSMYMSAYILEKGDRVALRTFLDDRFTVTGNILSVDRLFGQGKSSKINTFNVQIANPISSAHLELVESIIVDDITLLRYKGVLLPTEVLVLDDSDVEYSRVIELKERIAIEESLSFTFCIINGYGTCGYGTHGYGR